MSTTTKTFRAKRERKDMSTPSRPNVKRAWLCPHVERPHQARGLCGSCYGIWLKERNSQFHANQKANCERWQRANYAYRVAFNREWESKQGPNYKREKLLAKYGMTMADYDYMLAEQGGACAVCKRPPREGKALHVDHCHATGLVRGLLCFRCNYGLSYFSEDSERLIRAAEYLRSAKPDDTVADVATEENAA